MTFSKSTIEMSDEKVSSSFKSARFIQTLLIGISIILILLAFSDISDLLNILANLNYLYLFFAALAMCLSYFFITISYQDLFKLVKHHFKFGEFMTITVISTLINYYIATGGASGYALRAILLKKRNVLSSTTISVSLLQGLLTNISIIVLLLFHLSILVMEGSLSPFQLYMLLAPMSFIVILIFFVALIIFEESSTNQVFNIIMVIIQRMEIWFKITSKRYSSNFKKGTYQFMEAIPLFRSNKKKMIIPALEITFDWLCAMICLFFCFRAVNFNVPWTILASVYFIGIFLSFIFIVFGGLGIMEGGMAAVFYEFGVPWESALIAVLLYRLIYYVLPLFAVLPPYYFYIRSSRTS